MGAGAGCLRVASFSMGVVRSCICSVSLCVRAVPRRHHAPSCCAGMRPYLHARNPSHGYAVCCRQVFKAGIRRPAVYVDAAATATCFNRVFLQVGLDVPYGAAVGI